MVSYPPTMWEVRSLEDMDNMEGSPQTDSDFSFQVFLAVPPAEGKEGSFKFELTGRDHLMMEVPVSSILKDERFRGLAIHTQLQLGNQVNLYMQLTQLRYYSETVQKSLS